MENLLEIKNLSIEYVTDDGINKAVNNLKNIRYIAPCC